MKTLTRFLIIPMLSVAFFSCSESHFLKDVAYRNQVTQDFEMKKQQLPNGELFAVFNEKLTIPEQEALMFLYAYMPTGDVTDYTGDYYPGKCQTLRSGTSGNALGKRNPR